MPSARQKRRPEGAHPDVAGKPQKLLEMPQIGAVREPPIFSDHRRRHFQCRCRIACPARENPAYGMT
jgi:hypothetical protein